MMASVQQPLRIMVMAGGTGGHVYPALAVACDLRERGVEVTWLGTRRGLESEVVPRAGFEIDYIRVAGLRGKGWWSWFSAPGKLLLALYESLRVMRRRHPAAVLGMGGFVTGPGGLAAWLSHCPLLIHEQNARAGLTNRLLANIATRIMEAFPGSFAKDGLSLHTGNPLRREFVDKAYGETREAIHKPLRLLVVGGSLGAVRLNEVVPQAVAAMPEGARPEIWHQTGKRNLDSARSAYEQAGVEARVESYIEDMAAAYAWADLVLCRAGAMTVAELAASGVASILVPYPYAVDDHQTANAHYLSDQGAAVLLPQDKLDAQTLARLIQGMTADELQSMGEAARSMAKPEATQQVVGQCLEVVHD
jgi:UDP-N-acetylglucosamine--N-acetylmuramyl-(pentapeptide) pyrophosphoryl-undecaprenol N-acetylglucosamine transferase